MIELVRLNPNISTEAADKLIAEGVGRRERMADKMLDETKDMSAQRKSEYMSVFVMCYTMI